ncbi:hypothetical protein BHE74_00016192 [Ensete ventricosum]|nr:hypothetical protein BHE74_00016192 [Ensete ventricosum]
MKDTAGDEHAGLPDCPIADRHAFDEPRGAHQVSDVSEIEKRYDLGGASRTRRSWFSSNGGMWRKGLYSESNKVSVPKSLIFFIAYHIAAPHHVVCGPCGEVRACRVNSGTNPADLAEKVNSGINPGDLTEKVNSGTNPEDLAEKVSSGMNPGDLAERANSGTNLGDLAERVNSGTNPEDLAESTNPEDLAERANSGTNPGVLAERANSGTNPEDLAEKANSGTNPRDLVERVNSGTNPVDLAERVNSGINPEDFVEKVNSGMNPEDLTPFFFGALRIGFQSVGMTSSDSSSSVKVISSPGLGGASRSDPEAGSSGAYSGPPSPVDARVLRDLEVMKADHDLDTTVTEGSITVIRGRYIIPTEFGLHVPQPEQRPYSSDTPGMCISMDALEAGLRFPLHLLIEECIRWRRISPSQVAPTLWHYLVVFLGECRGAGITPTWDLFMACFRLCNSRPDYLTARVGFRVSGAPSNNKG